jgi:hypothetical protein
MIVDRHMKLLGATAKAAAEQAVAAPSPEPAA